MPRPSSRQSPTAKRSSPVRRPLKALTNLSCSVVSTLTQKAPRPLSGAWMDAAWLMQTNNEGGFMDTESTAVAVVP